MLRIKTAGEREQCPLSMTSIESTVMELYNQMYALYYLFSICIGPMTPEGQAEQSRMTEFSGNVLRLKYPQEKINEYKLKIEYYNSRINWRIGGGNDENDGSGSGGGEKKGAAGRLLTSNGTMHGQCNAVNSPASVQSPSACSQPVHQRSQLQARAKRIQPKTVRTLHSISPVSNPTV